MYKYTRIHVCIYMHTYIHTSTQVRGGYAAENIHYIRMYI